MENNVRFTNTTNPAFDYARGKDGFLKFENGMAYFWIEEERYYVFRTSLITKISKAEEVYNFYTLNSIYSFIFLQKVDLPKIAHEHPAKKKVLHYIHNRPSHSFLAISLTGFHEFIRFEEKITRMEAKKIIGTRDFPQYALIIDIRHPVDEADEHYGFKKQLIDGAEYISIDEIKRVYLLDIFKEFGLDASKQFVTPQEVTNVISTITKLEDTWHDAIVEHEEGNEKKRELIKEFPAIFTPDFYIQCEEGWFGIIRECCCKLMKYAKEQNIQPPVFQQITEKFGTLWLNFYFSQVEELEHKKAFGSIIDVAEEKSKYICERCGKKVENPIDLSNITISKIGKNYCNQCKNR